MKFEWISWDARDFYGVGLCKRKFETRLPYFLLDEDIWRELNE
jgi:hypothetical protein